MPSDRATSLKRGGVSEAKRRAVPCKVGASGAASPVLGIEDTSGGAGLDKLESVVLETAGRPSDQPRASPSNVNPKNAATQTIANERGIMTSPGSANQREQRSAERATRPRGMGDHRPRNGELPPAPTAPHGACGAIRDTGQQSGYITPQSDRPSAD